jgi:sRNA-binding regulator protein Hfq
LEVNVRDEKKILEIWLTNGEKDDPAVKASLRDIYGTYKRKKYTVAVFRSGDQNLVDITSDLLCYNRKRAAQMEVRRAAGSR